VFRKIRDGELHARHRRLCASGLNYARHAPETGKEVPKEPVIFMKARLPCAGRSTTW